MNYFLISIIVIVLLVRFLFTFRLFEGFSGKCIKSVLPPFTFDITTTYERESSGNLILDGNNQVKIAANNISDKALQKAKQNDIKNNITAVFELRNQKGSGLLSDPFSPNFKYFDTQNCDLI